MMKFVKTVIVLVLVGAVGFVGYRWAATKVEVDIYRDRLTLLDIHTRSYLFLPINLMNFNWNQTLCTFGPGASLCSSLCQIWIGHLL